MTTGFTRTITGRVVVRLDEDERALLRSLAEQVIAFISPEAHDDGVDPLAVLVGIGRDTGRPEDPALIRLLPDAYVGDDEASAEFRRFTERGLRELKVAHAQAVLDALGRSGDKVTLSPAELQSWLGFLNDARLALGVRLAITEDRHDELEQLPPEDPRFGMFQVYGWLSFLQESLVAILMPE